MSFLYPSARTQAYVPACFLPGSGYSMNKCSAHAVYRSMACHCLTYQQVLSLNVCELILPCCTWCNCKHKAANEISSPADMCLSAAGYGYSRCCTRHVGTKGSPICAAAKHAFISCLYHQIINFSFKYIILPFVTLLSSR